MTGSHLFVIPGPRSTLSGGNRYNEALFFELAAHSSVARADRAELAQALLAGPWQTVWVDSLYMDLLPPLRSQLARHVPLYLIAHSLPSLLAQAAADLPAAPPDLSRREAAWLTVLDAALAPSETMRAWLHERAPLLPVWVAEPAVGAAEASRASHACLQALMVANLVPNKGVLPFLQALRAQIKDGDELRLRCIGAHDVDPAYAAACLRERAAPELSARVELLGPRPYDAVLQALGEVHVLVSASRLESFGMAIADARASGCIVLARAGGHTDRLIDLAAGGELVSADGALAAALLRLARDPGERLARSLRAEQARLRPRSWREVAEPFLSLLSAQVLRNDQ